MSTQPMVNGEAPAVPNQPPPPPGPSMVDVLLLYYWRHQPRYGPQTNNTELNPPATPCFCDACAAVREMGVLVRPEARATQTVFIMQVGP